MLMTCQPSITKGTGREAKVGYPPPSSPVGGTLTRPGAGKAQPDFRQTRLLTFPRPTNTGPGPLTTKHPGSCPTCPPVLMHLPEPLLGAPVHLRASSCVTTQLLASTLQAMPGPEPPAREVQGELAPQDLGAPDLEAVCLLGAARTPLLPPPAPALNPGSTRRLCLL